MTVARLLAKWGAGLELDAVPQDAQHAAARHLLDGFGTALAALRTNTVAPALEVARSLGGPPEASFPGSRELLGAPAAAYATGALVHGHDFDDTHSGGLVHATAATLPAAWAVGQQVGATGADVLTAAVVGYETVCRIAMGSPHGFHARGLHATQVAGVFAAAAVTSRLLRLPAEAVTEALGIAGSSAGGLLEFLTTGSSTKQLHPASGALNGILAARLAAAGATGPDTVLEGPHGIYATLSARPADLDAVTADLGESWEVTRITIKPYPACQLMHVSLDATAAALRTAAIDPQDVVEVVAEVHPDSAAVVCEPAADKVAPRTVYDAKFSLPWCVAALLVDGRVDLDTFTEQSIARPAVTALASRVRTRLGGSAGVAADAAGRVEVRLRDGSTIEGAVARSVGGPLAPMSDDALLAKFLADAGDTPPARQLAERILDLPAEPDLRGLADLAARAAGA